MNPRALIAEPGERLSLSSRDPDDRCGYSDKEKAAARLQADIERLEHLQDVLSAQGKYAVLLVFQGMDTAGKDGAVKHVMSGVNPIGVNVYSFKAPSDEERKHDFLWRCEKVLPERGRIAIFNRSYYEDTLIVRVHPELLGPRADEASAKFWRGRFEAINAFERHLTQENTIVLKFFLHISNGEQRKRLQSRIDDPAKQWKCSIYDLKEREFWNDYVTAYEDAISATTTESAPWYVVPANHKYVARVAIANAIVARLEELDLRYPALSPQVAQELKDAGARTLTL